MSSVALLEIESLYGSGAELEALEQCEKLCRQNPNNFDCLHLLFRLKYRRGDKNNAVKILERLSQLNPLDPSVAFNICVLHTEMGQLERAACRYAEYIKSYPDDYQGWINAGQVELERERLDQALKLTRKAIGLDRTKWQGHLNEGLILYESRDYLSALHSCLTALSIEPNLPEILVPLGNCLARTGSIEQGLQAIDRAISVNPQFAEAWTNRGWLCIDLNRLDEARTSFQRAATILPLSDEPWRGLAVTGYKSARFDDALEAIKSALSLYPKSKKMLALKGEVFRRTGRHIEALQILAPLSVENPSDFEVYNNLGLVQYHLEDYRASLSSLETACRLQPDEPIPKFNLGLALDRLGRGSEAIKLMEDALDKGVKINRGYANLFNTQSQICDWRHYETRRETVRDEITQGENICPPFITLGMFDDPLIQRRAAESWVAESTSEQIPYETFHRTSVRSRIRVAYFSSDFKDHPVSYLVFEIIEKHDKRNFEIFGFSFSRDHAENSEVRNRLVRSMDHFIDASWMSDPEVVRLSRNLEIDIAVDLNGHTNGARQGVLRARVAPIQINWLGYPGTWGHSCMDYIIGDSIVITPENRAHFSESVVYLPNCFQPNPETRPVLSQSKAKQEFGFSRDGLVFVSFNNNWKVTPSILSCWSRILLSVPGSFMWLHARTPEARENISAAFERHGVGLDRLKFSPPLERKEYLQQYSAADIFLDTYPYNAGTTASDALWAHVPIVTLSGESFASRMASSLLSVLEMDELIARSECDYVRIAVELANSPTKLLKLKRKLGNAVENSPLFRSSLFTQDLERAYQSVHTRYMSGLPPDDVMVFHHANQSCHPCDYPPPRTDRPRSVSD